MKKTLFYAAGAAAMLLLAGCDTVPPGAERGPHNTMAYDVLVDASAPGAQIDVDGQVIGNTPVHLKIFGDPDGTFHDFGNPWYVVRATPLATNQFPQIRYFGTGHLFGPEDRIPQQIHFDMNQPPPAAPPVVYGAPGPYGPPVYYGPAYPYYWGPGVRVYVGPRYYYH